MTRNRSPLRSFYRSARIEPLEDRQLLSISPTLAPISNVTVNAGAPLYIALDGYDGDGDALTYMVTSSNSSVSASVLTGNQSMKISVAGYGDMIFELFEDRAPETTSQIIELIESGFYDGLIFHRIAEYSDGTPFVIQGGDPDGDGTGGPGFQFDDEFNPELLHTSSGILSMANSGDDTNGSQFFITGTATRSLDFNHSVFGFLTEGESVRQAIEAVEVNSSSKPLVDVVMTSVTVFYDEENGTLMLNAPANFTGETDITVTVDDGNGGTASRTFHVTVVADTVNSNPYLGEIDTPELDAGETITFQLPGHDVEGNALYYSGLVYPTSDDITGTFNNNGTVTLTAKSTAGGVYSLYVGVRAEDGSTWDTQYVSVYVAPAAPTSIVLLTSSDTGTSNTDGITNVDNELWFRVYGVIDGAEVSLYCDGTMVGQTIASNDGSVIIATNATSFLTEGTHQITAKQVLRSVDDEVGNNDTTVDIFGIMSEAIAITVDTTAPMIDSTAPNIAACGILYEYQVELETAETGVRYQLLDSPAGMTIDINTGLIRWTPTLSAGATQYVSLKATDAAGNQVTQTFTLYIKQPPLFDAQIADQTIAEGETLQFTVQATSQNGDPTVIYSLGANVKPGVTIDATTGVVTWTPTEAQGPGRHAIVIYAADSEGVKNNMTVWVDVTEVNLPPVLSPINDIMIAEGQLLSFTATATDADLPANALTYTLVGNVPAGVTIHPSTGKLTWKPNEYQGGQTFNLTVRVTDSAGASDETSFAVTVLEVDDAPIFKSQDSLQFAYPGLTFSTKFHAADPDVPTHSVEYSFVGDVPEGMIINTVTGQVTWEVPEETMLDQITITVRASEVLSDGSLCLSRTQTIQVMLARPWLAAMEEAMRAGSEDDSLVQETDESILTILAEAAPVQRTVSPQGNSGTLATGSLSSAEADFAAEQGFFGLQLGSSTASGTMEIQPLDTDAEGKPLELGSPTRDEKVIPANATEEVSRSTSRPVEPKQELKQKTAENTSKDAAIVDVKATKTVATETVSSQAEPVTTDDSVLEAALSEFLKLAKK